MTHRILVTGGFGYLGGRLAQFLDFQESYEILLGSRRPTHPPTVPMVPCCRHAGPHTQAHIDYSQLPDAVLTLFKAGIIALAFHAGMDYRKMCDIYRHGLR